MIEARQLVAMTDLIAQVLNQLSGSVQQYFEQQSKRQFSSINYYFSLIGSYYRILWNECATALVKDKNVWLYIVLISFILWIILVQFLKRFVNKQ